MSNAITIADEVSSIIVAGQQSRALSSGFTASRKVLPRYLIKDLTQPVVSVVPKTVELVGSTRSASEFNYDIEIGVQQKISDPETDVPGLVDLVDHISKYLRFTILTANKAIWVKAAIQPIYSVEHLSSDSVFTSVLTVTYKTLE
jgi:hypothetical protein